MAPNVGLRIKWTFSFCLLYSQFGLPLLSYYYFESVQYARSSQLHASQLISFKIFIGGYCFCYGLQFLVTLVDSGGSYFKLYSSFQLLCTLSSKESMTLVQSIASVPSLTSSGILFQEKNLKGALANQMILILFDDDASIIILLLDELHEPKLCLREESPGAMLLSFTIVHVHILNRLHHGFTGMKHTLRCRKIQWASKRLRENTACQ